MVTNLHQTIHMFMEKVALGLAVFVSVTERKSEMFIDHDKEIAYVAIPKTATYSIHEFFGYTTGHPEPEFHHMGCETMVDLYPQTRSYFKFAFVRNPWDKLWSTYADFTMRRVHQYSGKVRYNKPLLHEFADFEAFCFGLKDSRWSRDIFFVPQMDLVRGVDRIGRFESLKQDFKEICYYYGIEDHKPLSHQNKGSYDKTYREHYTSMTQRLIGELYAEDIEELGYAF